MGEDAAAAGALPVRVRAGYALGSLVTGTFGTVPGLLLLPYLTDGLAVPAAVAGLVVLLPKAWDVLLNPVAGRISDRTRSPWGPRRPYLLAGGLGLAVCFTVLFAAPSSAGPGPAAAWVALAFLLCATCFAFFQVPYIAMAAEITSVPQERTTLMAWRIAVLAVTILVSGAGAPALREAAGGADGYWAVGVAAGVLIGAGTLGSVLGTRGTPTATDRSTAGGARVALAALRGSRPFRSLLAAFVGQAVGVGAMLAGVDYVARVALGDPALQTWLFAGFVAPALLVMPLWQAVGRRWGKRRGYLGASVVFALAAASLLAARVLPVPALVALAALVGVGYAGMQVFPLALLPDVIAAEERRTGRRWAGVFSGVWTAGETLGMALGPGMYALVLALGGYVSGGGPTAQPPSAVTAVLVGFAVMPAVLVLGVLPLLRRDAMEVR